MEVARQGFGEMKGVSKLLKGTELPVGVPAPASASLLTVLCCLLVGEPGTSTTSGVSQPALLPFVPVGQRLGVEAAYASTHHKNGKMYIAN